MLEDDEHSTSHKVEKNAHILFWEFISPVFLNLYSHKNMRFRKQALFASKFPNIFLGEAVVTVFIISFGVSSYKHVSFYRQHKTKVRRKLKLRRTKRDESGLPNLTGTKSDDDLTLEEVRGNDQKSQRENSKSGDNNNTGEKRKLEQDDDDITDDEEAIVVLEKKDLPKRQKLSSVVHDSDSDELQDVNKKGCKRSPDGIDDPSPKRMAVSTVNKLSFLRPNVV